MSHHNPYEWVSGSRSERSLVFPRAGKTTYSPISDRGGTEYCPIRDPLLALHLRLEHIFKSVTLESIIHF